MIDELKVLLEMLGNVDNIALYVLGGFALYKLVVYLSGVGAAVMLTKLFINKCHSAYLKPQYVSKSVNLDGIFITHDGTYQRFKDFLNSDMRETYINNRAVTDLIAGYRYFQTLDRDKRHALIAEHVKD